MRAVFYERYGSPEVLELKEIERPSVSGDEILVKVYAASVQPMDIRFRTGDAASRSGYSWPDEAKEQYPWLRLLRHRVGSG